MSAIGKVIAGIGLFVVGTLLTLTGPIGTAIGRFLIVAGLSLALQGIIGLFQKPPSTDNAVSKINVRLPEAIRWMNGGLNRQGGAVIFGEFDQNGGLWYLIVHCDSILVETYTIFFDDLPITLDGSGNVITWDFCLNNKNEPYEGSGTIKPYFKIWTTTYSEDDPTPPGITALMTAFPSWTVDHKLVGTTYSVVFAKSIKIEDRYKVYKWRGPLGLGEPALSIAGQWSNMYDPRDDTQTLGDRSTYKPSSNSVLIWAWFRTHRFGRNKSENSINWDRIAEQADICDQTVVGIEGSSPRYRTDTSIPEDRERSTAEQDILNSMDGQLVFDNDGKCWVRCGHYYAPSLVLSRNRDIIAMESIEAQNLDNPTQGVIVRYTDPASNYITQPSAPWYNPNFYVEGEAASFITLDMPEIQNHNQAMRVAKSFGMRLQPLHKLAPTTGLRGLVARQERIINLNYDNTFAGDYEIISPVEVNDVGIFCNMTLSPMDENRFILLSGEEKPKPVYGEGVALPVPDAPTGVVSVYNNGRIETTFDDPNRDDVKYEIDYIETDNIASDVWLHETVQMLDNFAYSAPIPTGVEYSVRNRSRAASGRVSAWSTPVPVEGADTLYSSTNLTVTGGVGQCVVSWRNPLGGNFGYTKTYRGTTTVFSAATFVTGSTLSGGLGQYQGVTDTPLTAGTYYYWNVAYTVDDTASTPTGPVQGIVT